VVLVVVWAVDGGARREGGREGGKEGGMMVAVTAALCDACAEQQL
jgi:hypothetical protein